MDLTVPESNLRQSVKAAYLWDGVSSELRENITLVFEQGVITEITSSRVDDALDLGNAVIIPPLANVHAHLEFSHLEQPLTPALPFTQWIGKTMETRLSNRNVQRSIEKGIAESTGAGVALLGEIVTHSTINYTTKKNAPSLLLFRELIGLTPCTVQEQEEIVSSFLQQCPTQHTPGLSPHAPYTVRPELLERCIEWACRFNLPVTMHLAETKAELELMQTGTGEIVEMLRRLDLWDPQMIEPKTKPLDYLRLLANAPRVILAHGNYLSKEEIDFLAGQVQMSIAYCPRTHAFFQHDRHRWHEMIEAGVNVALGTDGRGSNPDLDLWKEVQFLGKTASSERAEQILRMATVNGWRACGLSAPLETGARACWTIIRRPDQNTKPFSSWSDLISKQTCVETVDHSVR